MFWNKKPKVAPVAKYRIVSKEVSFDCHLQKTLIYMKDGTKHRLIVKGVLDNANRLKKYVW